MKDLIELYNGLNIKFLNT